MSNYVTVQFDLYINTSDLINLENGDSVIGYKQVSNPENYELISKFAFLPAIKINENQYSVCAINK